jgi:anthranilate phosphoribosyltransferase
MTIQEAIRKVTERANLTREEMKAVFGDIMSGKATDAQIAAFIVALRMKGETIEEITGAAEVMREKVTAVVPSGAGHILDTCGTGGDGAQTFNISTAAALVAAGAGATVSKHGNRGMSSKCGSADVLEALGVRIAVPPEVIRDCLDKAGIGFLFAPSLHTAMKHAIGPRKEIAIRTIFNILGPLTNPSRARHQLLGVFSAELTEPLARTLANMGTVKAYVVHGMNKLDEVSLSDETQVSEVSNGKVETYRVKPEDFGLARSPVTDFAGGSPQENAAIIREVLSGAKGRRRDIVVLNAAFDIAAAEICQTPKQGLPLAQKSIDSGAAMEKLDQLIALTTAAG